MTRKQQLRLFILLCSIVLILPCTLFAQDTDKSGERAGETTPDTAPALTVEKVKADLEAIEKNAAIDDAVKALLRAKYQQAIEALQSATELSTAAADFREALETAPDETKKLREQLQALPSAEEAANVQASDDVEELQKDLAARRIELRQLRAELEKASSRFTRTKSRPVEISQRLPEAQREIAEIKGRLESSEFAADTASPGRTADRITLEARQAKLVDELEALKQEQLSQSVREDLLQAQRELMARQLENVQAAVDTLEPILRERLLSAADEFADTVNRIRENLPPDDRPASELIDEVEGLVQQYSTAVRNLEAANAATAEITNFIAVVNVKYETIKEQLKLTRGGGQMAQKLFDARRKIREAPQKFAAIDLPTLAETRLAALEINNKALGQAEIEEEFADHASDAVANIVKLRSEVLDKLRSQYRTLTQTLSVLEGEQQKLLDTTAEVDDFLKKQRLWLQSSPPISIATVTEVPTGIRWAFGNEHQAEVVGALRWAFTERRTRTMAVLFAAILLLLLRKRIIRALEDTGARSHLISTDSYAHTIKAAVCTLLLALPIPLLIAYFGWILENSPDASNWLLDSAACARLTAAASLWLLVLAEVCRPGGLGDTHFRWTKAAVSSIRRTLLCFAAVYVPAMFLVISYYIHGRATSYFDSVGRLVFMLTQVWTAFLLYRLFYGREGLLAIFGGQHTARVNQRWRYLWCPLMIAIPVAMIVLAAVGYLITAVELSLGLLYTVIQIGSGYILYSLAWRWFMIKERRLALAEALERRREKQAAAQEEGEGPDETLPVELEAEQQLDLEVVGKQTRTVLMFLFGLGVAAAIVSFWSTTIPVLSGLDAVKIPLGQGLSLLGVVKALLIVAVTVVVTRNLPGLLELSVLRATDIDPGTRYAMATLGQYAVTALGLVALFAALNIDWSQFGWIAAALSVGLGFGLQEVVANFVCGLILLFEQPIRIGDIVTLGETTGTVTKIRMRATTITNWDRQDFVVPNKNLITGTILNWTLSASVNRIVIPVGVAYGTDTDKARQILLDVCAEHPNIMDDPAPMATFEQFSDSSLNLILRAYLPNMDSRLSTISELHTKIDRRFAEAGIEIAFPQRDLHLRSGFAGTKAPSADDGADGQRKPAPDQAK